MTHMKNGFTKTAMNGHRHRSSLRHRLRPKLFRLSCLIAFAFAAVDAGAQCYFDALTGQTVCLRQGSYCPQCQQRQQCPECQPCQGGLSRPASSGASAGAQALAVDSTGHCRISVADGTTGSGTLVGRNDSLGLVLTCAHLFDTCTTRIVVTFPHGGRFGANLVQIDQANDLAALAIRRPEIAPLDVGDAEPSGALTVCGFGPNGVFRAIRGPISGRAMATGATYPSTTIAGAVRPGDSGGGVLDTSNKVVGVVWGERDGETYATVGRPLYEFLAGVRAKLFATPVVAAKPVVPQSPAASASSSPTHSQTPANSGSPATPQFDPKAWISEIDSRLRAMEAKKQDKGDYLQPGDLNRYMKVDDVNKLTDQFISKADVENKLKSVVSQFESIHGIVETVKQHVDTVRQQVDEISGDRPGALEGLSFGKLIAGSLGLSGPIAAAVALAGGLAGRRIHSRLSSLEARVGTSSKAPSTSTSPSRIQPIAVDSPPPAQRTVPETHYVPVETDTFAKAHQWASEHVARKYPGATEILQAQDSLIKQFLAAK